ncbi:MAG: hypothetical protein QXF57_02795, partial [Acidilobaceae archaeon]
MARVLATALLAVVALTLLASLSLVASAGSRVSLLYSIEGNVLRVSNPFYSLELNLENGLSPVSWIALDARAEWGSVAGFTLDVCSDKGLESGAPALGSVAWTHSVLSATRDVLVVSLRPAAADTCASPLSVTLVASFYSWLPYVDVLLVVSNEGNETVRLAGSQGAPAVAVSLPVAPGYRAVAVSLDRVGLAVHEEPGDYLKIAPKTAAIALLADGSLRAVYGVSDASLGVYAVLSFSLEEGRALLKASLPARSIASGEHAVFSFKLALASSDAIAASLAGFAPAYATLESGGFETLLSILPLKRYLEESSRLVEELRGEIRELEAKVGE